MCNRYVKDTEKGAAKISSLKVIYVTMLLVSQTGKLLYPRGKMQRFPIAEQI